METKVEIIKRETIKPSSRTPPDHKTLKLSILDQINPYSYVPIILFYPNNGYTSNFGAEGLEMSRKLKISLSEVLTKFYPFAGRIKENAFLECSDEGATYIEARINCLLMDFLEEPDVEVLKQLLPVAIESNEAAEGGCLLHVKVTFFDCGGMAIGVCLSHKTADASSLTAFLKCWAAVARGDISTQMAMSPVFMAASIFPPIDLSTSMPPPLELMQLKCVTKRFVLDASKITKLRTKAASARVPNPTRVEAVSMLVWKCAIVSSRSNSGLARPCVLSHNVNLRKRLVPTLPENYVGNCTSFIGIHTEDSELDLQVLVGRMRKEIKEFSENRTKKLQGKGALLAICESANKWGALTTSKDVEFYSCTSWCKFDTYDTDLGWGKPMWSSIAGVKFKNSVLLLDAKDGQGIEAWVTLTEEDMAFFESDGELLEFAALNPSVPFS